MSRGLVPDSVIDKPKTGFFNGVARAWMQEQLRGPAADYLLHGRTGLRRVPRLRRDPPHGAGAQDNAAPRDLDAFYAVLMLEVWLKTVLPKAISPYEAPSRDDQVVSMNQPLTFAAITPTRNEAENLRRLAPCMAAQTHPPVRWIIVDNGSTDETPAIARELADQHPGSRSWRSRARS